MPRLTQLKRVVNPRRRATKARNKFSRRRKTRRNPLPGGGVLSLMTNPKKRRSRNVRRRRRSNPFKQSTKSYRRRRRSNPFMRKYRRRSNPVISGMSLTDLVKIGASAAAGGYATRSLTQLVLQSNNEGWMGYAANFVAAGILGWAGDKFLGKDYAIGIIAGGWATTFARIWDEQISKMSPAQLSGLGDVSYAGMGDYVQTPYSIPSVSTRNAAGQYIVQQPPWPSAVPALPAAGGAKMATGTRGMGRTHPKRFTPRWQG